MTDIARDRRFLVREPPAHHGLVMGQPLTLCLRRANGSVEGVRSKLYRVLQPHTPRIAMVLELRQVPR